MFASLRRLVGLISVRESGDMITISGLPGNTVQKSIYDIWNTRKIVDNVFTHISNSEVSFNRFFAVDVAYILNRIIVEKPKGHNIRALKRTVELLFENTWLKNTIVKHPDILNYSHLNELNVTMMTHQMDFFKIYNELVPKYNLNGYLLGADPGTGKTLMCIGLSLCLGSDIMITVCPKNAVHRVWADTLKERFKKIPKYWTSLDDTEPERDTKYYICHFDGLEKLLEILKKRGVSGKVTIALDESHGLNEEESLRAQLFMEICRITKSENIIWSSGTPIKAIGREATPLFSTIDPLFDEDAKRRFQAIYGKSSSAANDVLNHRMGKVHYHVAGASVLSVVAHTHTIKVTMPNGHDYTLDALAADMRKFVTDKMAYYQKYMRDFVDEYENALKYFEKTLPKQTIAASLADKVGMKPNEQWDEYRKYRKYIEEIRAGFDPRAMAEISAFCNHYEKKVIMPVLPKPMRDNFKNVRSIVKYYQLKVQGEALGQVLGKKRVQCHEDMMAGEWFEVTTVKKEEVLTKTSIAEIIDGALKKTIIFTSYVPVVDQSNKVLKGLGYKPILVYGATNNDLAAHVGTFEKNPDVNPLIATFASLSTAVPLVMANNTIMTNVPFRSYEYEQAVARTKRNGQDEDVHIWNVKLNTGDEPNISTRSHDIMTWSKQQVEEILGGHTAAPKLATEDYGAIITAEERGEPIPQVFIGSFLSLEEFAEMEDYNDEWTAQGQLDEPVAPSWVGW